MTVNELYKKAGRKISDNSPAILTAMGVGGVVSTAYLTARATAKSVHELYLEGAYYDHEGEELSFTDKARVVWTNYIPPVAVGATTIGCIVGSHGVHTHRQAALMGLYSLTETTFSEYRNKVTEIIGEKEETRVREEIDKDHIQNTPVSDVIFTGSGDHLCYDSFTGRYFRSSVETLRRAQNTINAQIINDGYASQNDFYREIGIGTTSQGEEIGWRVENMLELTFSSQLTPDGQPALAVNYRAEPVRDYYRNS